MLRWIKEDTTHMMLFGEKVLNNLKYESEIWKTKNRRARHKVKGISEESEEKDKEMKNRRKEIRTLEDQYGRSNT